MVGPRLHDESLNVLDDQHYFWKWATSSLDTLDLSRKDRAKIERDLVRLRGFADEIGNFEIFQTTKSLICKG